MLLSVSFDVIQVLNGYAFLLNIRTDDFREYAYNYNDICAYKIQK